MNVREYEIMFRHEDRYFWYRGMRRIARSVVPEVFTNGGRVLDAGAGTGANLSHVSGSPAKPKTFGVDLAFEAILFSRSRGLPRMAQASVEALPLRGESFDALTCQDVLCNVPDDVRALAEYRRVLRPGGLLYVTVPAYAWLFSEHDRAVHVIRRYSKAELLGKLEAAGFLVERTTFANSFLLAPIVAVRKLRSLLFAAESSEQSVSDFHLTPGPLNAILGGILALEAFLLKFLSLPAGVTLIAKARRPADPKGAP